MGPRQQRVDRGRILLQSPVSCLAVPPEGLDNAKGRLHARPRAVALIGLHRSAFAGGLPGATLARWSPAPPPWPGASDPRTPGRRRSLSLGRADRAPSGSHRAR